MVEHTHIQRERGRERERERCVPKQIFVVVAGSDARDQVQAITNAR
jgi:hypothetical protein